MDPTALVAVTVAVLVLASLYARREHIHHELRRLLGSTVVAVVAFAIARQTQASPGTALTIAALFGFVVFSSWRKRSRYPRAAARRRTIAKWELETGKKYNAQRYEVDHKIPFVQGGSNTEDNLQVIEKKRNRAKGGRGPFWDLLRRR